MTICPLLYALPWVLFAVRKGPISTAGRFLTVNVMESWIRLNDPFLQLASCRNAPFLQLASYNVGHCSYDPFLQLGQKFPSCRKGSFLQLVPIVEMTPSYSWSPAVEMGHFRSSEITHFYSWENDFH